MENKKISLRRLLVIASMGVIGTFAFSVSMVYADGCGCGNDLTAGPGQLEALKEASGLN